MQFLKARPRGLLHYMPQMTFWRQQEAANTLVMMSAGEAEYQRNVSAWSSSASASLDLAESMFGGGEAVNLVQNPPDELLLEGRSGAGDGSSGGAEDGDALGIEIEIRGEAVVPSFGRIDRNGFWHGGAPEVVYTQATFNSPDQSCSTVSSSSLCPAHQPPITHPSVDSFCLDANDPYFCEVAWNVFDTLLIVKKMLNYVPRQLDWCVNGPLAPMRKSITFLSHLERASVTVYLGRRMCQTVVLERGANVFTWSVPNLRLDMGSHTLPSCGLFGDYLSFGAAGDTRWEMLPFGMSDRASVAGFPNRNLDEAEEDWDSIVSPRYIVAVLPSLEPLDLSIYVRQFHPYEIMAGNMNVPANYPLNYAFCECTYYDISSFTRFTHPVDQGGLIVLPQIGKRFDID
jgi:hypothetical protein